MSIEAGIKQLFADEIYAKKAESVKRQRNSLPSPSLPYEEDKQLTNKLSVNGKFYGK